MPLSNTLIHLAALPAFRRAACMAALLVSMGIGIGVAQAREGVSAHGVALPGGSEQVGENRYRSPLSYDDTLKFFKTTYPGYPRKPIINQPGVKAVHVESAEARSGWEGFNVYELNGREVRVFVIPRANTKKEEKRHR